MKRPLWCHEFNLAYEGRAYLPLVSGQLLASAFHDPALRDAYEVGALCYAHEPLSAIAARWGRHAPDVAGFSVSLWNEQLSLAVAHDVHQRFPDCLIVFGGCQVPFDGTAYLAQYPFIDLCVRGEGETTFAEILQARAAGQSFRTVAGLTGQDRDGLFTTPRREGPRDLDVYPSPYLEGFFDPLVAGHPEIAWQAIIETNRGCPFSCAFCYWGNALNQKYRLFSVDRTTSVIRWLADHRIQYVFNADANFGMIPQDQQILDALIQSKRATGYPEKFRTCWGKNSNEKIYQMAKRLHEADMDKSLTLSRQSQDPTTLQNVHRSNIRLDTYAQLQRQANADGVPVYSELIFGMPGETEASWLKGLTELLHAGVKNQIFIYHCEVLPNTAMADPAYLAQHGIVTQGVPLQPIHCHVAAPGTVQEYDRIIVSTATMPPDTWRRLTVFNWLFQLAHGLKAMFYPLVALQALLGRSPIAFLQFCLDDAHSPLLHAEIIRWQDVAFRMQHAGAGRAGTCAWPGLGGTWWEQEELSFFHLMAKRSEWRNELAGLGFRFLTGSDLQTQATWASSVVFQWALWPDPLQPPLQAVSLSSPLPERLESCLLQGEISTIRPPTGPGTLHVSGRAYEGDWRRFADEVILKGRKSGTILHGWRWEPDTPVSTRESPAPTPPAN